MGSSQSSGKVKEKQVKTKIKTNFDEKMYNPQRDLQHEKKQNRYPDYCHYIPSNIDFALKSQVLTESG